VAGSLRKAAQAFAGEVAGGVFPGPEHAYR
jgi:ketopantoate hydroxymethyltransferase